MVHPYDQEDTWAGHSTIIHEIKEQLGQVSRTGKKEKFGSEWTKDDWRYNGDYQNVKKAKNDS